MYQPAVETAFGWAIYYFYSVLSLRSFSFSIIGASASANLTYDYTLWTSEYLRVCPGSNFNWDAMGARCASAGTGYIPATFPRAAAYEAMKAKIISVGVSHGNTWFGMSDFDDEDNFRWKFGRFSNMHMHDNSVSGSGTNGVPVTLTLTRPFKLGTVTYAWAASSWTSGMPTYSWFGNSDDCVYMQANAYGASDRKCSDTLPCAMCERIRCSYNYDCYEPNTASMPAYWSDDNKCVCVCKSGSSGKCESPYHINHGPYVSQYKVVSGSAVWNAASALCGSGYATATFPSRSSYDEFMARVGIAGPAWLGASDTAAQNSWVWQYGRLTGVQFFTDTSGTGTGTLWSYTYPTYPTVSTAVFNTAAWASGQPTRDTGLDCLGTTLWSGVSCTAARSYTVCERSECKLGTDCHAANTASMGVGQYYTHGSGTNNGCTCTCKAGWGGAKCETRVCHTNLDCNGRAVSGSAITGTYPNCKCSCIAGWGGDMCAQPACTVADDCVAANTNNVSGHRPSCSCECEAGWGGDLCQDQLCILATDCNGRGTAITGEKHPSCVCSCPSHFRGNACEERVCHTSLDCNGRGRLVSGAYPNCTCMCLAGYRGRKCELVSTQSAVPTQSASLSLQPNANASMLPTVSASGSLGAPTITNYTNNNMHKRATTTRSLTEPTSADCGAEEQRLMCRGVVMSGGRRKGGSSNSTQPSSTQLMTQQHYFCSPNVSLGPLYSDPQSTATGNLDEVDYDYYSSSPLNVSSPAVIRRPVAGHDDDDDGPHPRPPLITLNEFASSPIYELANGPTAPPLHPPVNGTLQVGHLLEGRGEIAAEMLVTATLIGAPGHEQPTVVIAREGHHTITFSLPVTSLAYGSGPPTGSVLAHGLRVVVEGRCLGPGGGQVRLSRLVALESPVVHLPKPKDAVTGIEAAAKGTGTTAGVVTAVGGGIVVPVVAMQQGVAMALLRMANCEEDALDGEPLDVLVHPLQFGIGGGVTAYARGAVAANLALLPAAWGLLSYHVVPRVMVFLTTAGVSGDGPRPSAATRARAVQAAREGSGWPSTLLIPYAMFGEGSAMATVALLTMGSGGGPDAGLGAIGVLLLAASVALWAYLIRARLPYKAMVLRREEREGVLSRALDTRWEWDVNASRDEGGDVELLDVGLLDSAPAAPLLSPSPSATAGHLSTPPSLDVHRLLTPYNHAYGEFWWLWAALAGHLFALVVGAAEGMPNDTPSLCRARWALACVGAVLQSAVVLTCTIPLQLVLLGVTSALICVLMVLLTLASNGADADSSASSVASAMGTVGTVNALIGIALMVLGIGRVVYEVWGARQAAIKKKERERAKPSEDENENSDKGQLVVPELQPPNPPLPPALQTCIPEGTVGMLACSHLTHPGDAFGLDPPLSSPEDSIHSVSAENPPSPPQAPPRGVNNAGRYDHLPPAYRAILEEADALERN